jgi:plasmid maintenance system antidote protein VapI
MRMHSPVHPGRFLRSEVIEAHNLSVTEAAKADLSGEMALRFEKAFGVDMDSLMRMQNSYDIAQTRSRAKEINVARYEPRPAA